MSPLKIVALPRDPNPYQELLYGALRARGARTRYGCALTPSHSLNLLLLPLELLWLRWRGYRVLHLHWTFGFRFPGAQRSRAVQRLGRMWFGAVLQVARRAGLRIVWTAHNVLPHDSVFDDDIRARRTLVRACELVIAHSQDTLLQLGALGWNRRQEVIPHGPMGNGSILRLEAPRAAGRRTVLFFGKIAAYKGLDDLVDAARGLGNQLQITIAGSCADQALAARLRTAAETAGTNITLLLGHVPDSDLPALFSSAHALVFPFRAVSTSGSVLLGLSVARAVIVPDLPAFRDLPADAVMRYRPGQDGLRQELLELARMPADTLEARGRAARTSAELGPDWDEIADSTIKVMTSLLPPEPLGDRTTPVAATVEAEGVGR